MDPSSANRIDLICWLQYFRVTHRVIKTCRRDHRTVISAEGRLGDRTIVKSQNCSQLSLVLQKLG